MKKHSVATRNQSKSHDLKTSHLLTAAGLLAFMILGGLGYLWVTKTNKKNQNNGSPSIYSEDNLKGNIVVSTEVPDDSLILQSSNKTKLPDAVSIINAINSYRKSNSFSELTNDARLESIAETMAESVANYYKTNGGGITVDLLNRYFKDAKGQLSDSETYTVSLSLDCSLSADELIKSVRQQLGEILHIWNSKYRKIGVGVVDNRTNCDIIYTLSY